MSRIPPVLSILLPTCQRPDFLRQALRSVLDNGFSESMEIIVSDDAPEEQGGSAAEKVVAEFGLKSICYTRHPPPQDKPGNWQHAALLAKGEFFFKLDDDDLVLPGFFSQAIAYLRAHPQAASVYPAFLVEEMATGWREEVRDASFFARFGNLVPGEAYLRAVLVNEGGYPRNHKSTACYRRTVAKKMGHYGLACEDFAFGAALALHGAVGYLPEPLFIWRRHAGSYLHHRFYTWQMSQRALAGLQKIKFLGGETVSQEKWLRLVDQCRQALPLYYLLAALRTSSREEAAQLRRQMEQAYIKPLPHAGKISLLFFFHRLGGNRLVHLLNDLYFKGSIVQQIIKKLFRS